MIPSGAQWAAGAVIAAAVILAVVYLARPTIAQLAGDYVQRHAFDRVPPAVQPLAQALGPNYSALLGDATEYAFREALSLNP